MFPTLDFFLPGRLQLRWFSLLTCVDFSFNKEGFQTSGHMLQTRFHHLEGFSSKHLICCESAEVADEFWTEASADSDFQQSLRGLAKCEKSQEEWAGRVQGGGGGGHLPSRGLVRPLLLQSNWMGGSTSCWRSKRGGQTVSEASVRTTF